MIFARPLDHIPDFDRLVVRSRYNLGPVRGKRHRPDVVVVGVGLLTQQLQLVCQASQQASQFRPSRDDLSAPAHLNPRL
ncbi:hypothetical protein Ctob_014224 [Chrysochromulina tobinii]|uniref:Uncharacterized protein n=1 Tax=Chrysochromulina tobinii TaxID=1460289 RepID=A0A0M0JPC8_9EUKA|nr:hypothetical protein Ctob_014224 [Chrysochromulina tobinii]|eukprot:KOO28162.1 hypothetical protein Ctob_014224 [Chrysochromulina sp. CCMP291]